MGKGLFIHLDTCSKIQAAKHKIPVRWADKVLGVFSVILELDTIDRLGVLAMISVVVSDMRAGVADIKMLEKGCGVMNVILELKVHSCAHLAKIISRIRQLKYIFKMCP